MQENLDTKRRILNAAMNVFAEKGKAGARIQEIADLAEVNKAMIYYYYSSKDGIYEAVFDTAIGETFGEMIHVAVNNAGSAEKVKQVVNNYVDFYLRRKDVFQLLLREIVDGGEVLRRTVLRYKDEFDHDPETLPARIIQEGIDQGVFRPLDANQTFMSLIGMSIVYALGRPIYDVLLGVECADLTPFLEERRLHITDLLLKGLLVNHD